MSGNKFLAILTAAGLTAGVGTVATNDMSALAKNFESASEQALQAFLQGNPTSSDAPEAFHVLASRFKPPDDKGRPDLFGPPGVPVIGPPGQYAG